MKQHRVLYTTVIIFIILISSCVFTLQSYNKASRLTQTDIYEMEFYVSLLYALEKSNRIYLDDLVPTDWDTMKIFTAYETKEKKIRTVGYEYGENLQDITHEDVVSLVFMKEAEVVYYVDALVPRRFRKKIINSTEAELSLENRITTKVNRNKVKLLKGWGYTAEIKEASRGDKPYFDVVNTENDKIMLTLKTH